MWHFIKVPRVEADFISFGKTNNRRAEELTDRQTDTTKLIVAFRNFAKAPRNYN